MYISLLRCSMSEYMSTNAISRGNHSYVVFWTVCGGFIGKIWSWSFDCPLLKLSITWFTRQNGNCACASLVSMIPWFLLFGGHLDPWSTLKKDVDCLIPFWSQLRMLLQVTCNWLPLVYVFPITGIFTVTHSTSAFTLPKYPRGPCTHR